jgi:hypothetical protein
MKVSDFRSIRNVTFDKTATETDAMQAKVLTDDEARRVRNFAPQV